MARLTANQENYESALPAAMPPSHRVLPHAG
jgi:hypothetical protein